MIKRFIKVTDGLYRGGAPSPKDVKMLHDKFGINKIISLDLKAGQRISKACSLLGIKHIMIPLDESRVSLMKLLKYDIKDLLLEGGPTFVHCFEGKDRTGLLIGLFKCKYMGESPEEVLEEAKSLGFGAGVDAGFMPMIHLYEKIIKSCKPRDVNSADIVSNEREYISDNRGSYLDEGHQGSFEPYLQVTRQNPMDAVYVGINDQSPTRENYKSTWSDVKKKKDDNAIPQVGVFNNDAGGRGFGPTENFSGFFYD